MLTINGTTHGPGNPFIGSGAGLNKELDPYKIGVYLGYADGVVAGSITPKARDNNGGRCEAYTSLFGLNSWGMPNVGMDGVPDPSIDDTWETIQQRIILSIAGEKPMEYDLLFRQLAGYFGAIELNFGCPNVRNEGVQPRIVSFDPETMAQILDLIGVFEASTPVWIKLSPYSDPGMLAEIAALINEAKRDRTGHIVDVVVTGNSFPNGRGYLDGEAMIETDKAGLYGGVTGEVLKPISLGNAAKFRELLDPSISVVRCGGISSGMDIWESSQVGCDGVQVVTHIQRHNPMALGELRKQYRAL